MIMIFGERPPVYAKQRPDVPPSTPYPTQREYGQNILSVLEFFCYFITWWFISKTEHVCGHKPFNKVGIVGGRLLRHVVKYSRYRTLGVVSYVFRPSSPSGKRLWFLLDMNGFHSNFGWHGKAKIPSIPTGDWSKASRSEDSFLKNLHQICRSYLDRKKVRSGNYT